MKKKRILWIVNIVMPELASAIGAGHSSSGTWLIDIASNLSQSSCCDLAIACVHGDKYAKYSINNISYYLLPGDGKNMLFYTKKYEKYWRKICSDFNPDIVHIHGTEYSHGLACMRALPNLKYVISIQGILSRIKDVDFGGLTFAQVLRYRTLKEFIRFNGMLEMHLLHCRNARFEKEMIHRAQYANCVNTWDKSVTESINPDIKVFKLEYNLREEFYAAPKWSKDHMVPYTIFTNPGGTPLKGVHQLFKALSIVKRTYPQVKLYIPGMGTPENRINVTSGYTKYLKHLLVELELERNVIFLGRQTGKEMMNRMREANVVVVPSAIEGTSLVLREAMFMGCPCISSFRGGMADFISDKVDGYLYDYDEYSYLAKRIIDVFGDSEIMKMSRLAIQKAEKSHDRRHNISEWESMYNVITSYTE